MMEFKAFKQLQQQQFRSVINGQDVLFVTDVDKDVLWETYLDSFPEGTNELYRERREFDCSCCKQFVRSFGDVVVIGENSQLTSIWDMNMNDGKFAPVVSALAELVKSAPVKDVFVRRVFEALGSKMRVEKSSEQLSGLGFSSTQRNSLICKVDGRMVKVIF